MILVKKLIEVRILVKNSRKIEEILNAVKHYMKTAK